MASSNIAQFPRELIELEERHKDLSFLDVRNILLKDEPSGWSIFVDKYSRFVYTVALKLIGPTSDAEELAHEIYYEVFEKLHENDFRIIKGFKGKAEFQTYLFRIVQTIKSKVLRNLKKHHEKLDFVDFTDQAFSKIASHEEWSRAVDWSFISVEEIRKPVLDTVGELNARERLMLRLRFQKGLKLREIADLMNLPDTNKAAYELRKILDKFKFLNRLCAQHQWDDRQFAIIIELFEQTIFE